MNTWNYITMQAQDYYRQKQSNLKNWLQLNFETIWLIDFNGLRLLLYCHLQHHNDTIIKTQEDFFNKICTSHFIARVRRGYSRFACERELETEQKLQYFDPHFYGRQRCVFLVLLMLNRRPTLLGDGFLYCILSATSLGPNSSGPQGRFGLMWLSLPHLVYNSVRSLTATLISVLTEIYNSSTPTQSPTRSLESHVGSSSSGNNCHAVQRSPFHQPISAYAISSHNCH